MSRANYILSAILVLCFCFASGCSYSFTGSSVPTHLKTIAIPLFDDQSGFGEPGLREEFTNELIKLFTQDNSLEVTDKTRTDSVIESVISAVSDEPLVVTKGESVSKRRVTITVDATYRDLKLKKKIWGKKFSNTGDYDIVGGLAQRQTGIDAAIKKITEDILLQTVSGW